MAAIWGRICCLPCEACGKLCEVSCRACSKACSALDQCLCPPNRPSPIFLTFTLIFAGVPGIVSLFVGVVNAHENCDESLALFLILQGVLGVFWLSFAVHLYKQFSKPYTVDSQDTGPMSRMYRLCMYDPFFCLLVLVFPGHIAWSVVGLQWLGSVRDCPNALEATTRTSATLSLVYLGVGIGVALISMCCECCRSQSPPQPQHNHHPASHAGAHAHAHMFSNNLAGRLLYPQVVLRPPEPALMAMGPSIPVAGATNPMHPGCAQPSAPPMPADGLYPGAASVQGHSYSSENMQSHSQSTGYPAVPAYIGDKM